MKKYLTFLFIILLCAFQVQEIIAQPASTTKVSGVLSTTSNPVCSCLVTLDSGFVDVPFPGGFGPYHSCDDGSFGPLALPFSFCYYGTSVSSVFINNNGNISFGNPYSMFISSPFPNTNYNMITPFWADIDTRGIGLSYPKGRVRYKLTPTALIVKWDSVGYFGMQGNKGNTFQLTITDGLDPLAPGGNNVSFCYGDMQWTNGGGTGLSGTPSTTGVNNGDGVNYFQIARCDHDSTDYDGPYGNNDGISYLDGKSFFLSTCTGGGLNVPPIAVNDNCDSIFFHSAFDSTLITIRFIGPEANQIVSAQLLANPNAQVVSSTNGVDASLTIKVLANASGFYPDLEIVATDNAGATTTQYRHIGNDFTTSLTELASKEWTIYPNPTTGISKIKLVKAAQIRVLNAMGQLVFESHAEPRKEFDLNLSEQPKGIYFLQIMHENEVVSEKIVKE